METGSIVTGKLSMKRFRMIAAAGCLYAAVAGQASAQDQAILSGVQYLKAHASGQRTGESAMIALALIKSDVPPTDPALETCLAKIRARISSETYDAELTNGTGIYEAAAGLMALVNLDPEANKQAIQAIANYILSQQKANGSWDYTQRTAGDTSITQYATLGLWEADMIGVRINPAVWDRIASWYLSNQSPAGAWCYHRDEANQPDTLSMTAAGVGSLLICRRQLARFRGPSNSTSKLLKPLVTEGVINDYKPTTSNASIDGAVRRGMAWISANFAPTNATIAGQTPYYMLYGLERIGALSDRDTIGRLDWYARGRAFLTSTQRSDGSWNSAHGAEMNTCWAVLFLTKSTAKTIQKIVLKRLGGGTLLGGRGLPQDLNSLTVAGGRVVSRPMNGAIEGMLAVLEDPRAELAQAAVSGLVDRYYKEGPGALRPHKTRFRRMLAERDPSLRRVAVWALSRTGDFDVIPQLLEALQDREEEVVQSARMGLMLLSRKIDGYGPPAPSTAEQRKHAADRWRAWYLLIRPLDQIEDDDGSSTAGVNQPGAGAAAAPGGNRR